MSLPILFCCHLRYRDVQQRPQRIAQILAQSRPVIYIEEPWWPGGEERPFEKPPHLAVTYADKRRIPGDLSVITPVIPYQEVDLPYVAPENEALSRGMVAEYLGRIGVTEAIAWFYSPMMAGYYSNLVSERVIVHDKMDELTAFQGAPPLLTERERDLISRADVMFTGGQTMFENARDRHPNCHRFDSGVDFEHFFAATLPETTIAADLASLPRPVFGYFGVIDERMDFEAIRALASAFLQATVFLGGPVRKIDPGQLPRGQNIVYAYDRDTARGVAPEEAGKIPYGDLPHYLKGFDVALIPFSGRTEATRNLSPTKTPEYAAGLKPILSGAIPDVVSNWGDVVWVARSPDEYVRAARQILDDSHQQRLLRGQQKARENAWTTIVAGMLAKIDAVKTR
jgi:UDP-galactopyranose mutase